MVYDPFLFFSVLVPKPDPNFPSDNIKKATFLRHSSFDQICQVAEEERSKLYASMSLPASPTEDKQYDGKSTRIKAA